MTHLETIDKNTSGKEQQEKMDDGDDGDNDDDDQQVFKYTWTAFTASQHIFFSSKKNSPSSSSGMETKCDVSLQRFGLTYVSSGQ